MPDFDPKPLCGWFDDGGHQPLAATMPRLSELAPQLMQAADRTKPIMLWKAWEALGGVPQYPAQTIGDCVSMGHGHGNDLLEAVEYCLDTLLDAAIVGTCTEFIYGESRKVAGILGRQDGSYGAAAVKAMTTVGMISRQTSGPYSGKKAKQWGLSGPPTNLEQVASSYKLGAAANVSTWDELVAALANGYPVTECSTWLPSGKRDQDGFCDRYGSGGHCQLIIGVRFDKPGACIFNSWPQEFYSGPQALGIPQESCWVEQATVEKMLAGGDCWALSGSPGFPPKTKGLPGEWERDE
jgi:hypothetical protein